MQPSNSEFEQFCSFLEKASGIVLASNKQYLVTSRLNKLMRQENIASLGELMTRLQREPSRLSEGSLRSRVVDAMTTNETLWFRDIYPYEVFKSRLLPEFAKDRHKTTLRIWSAACSTGQEPYSLSMSVDEFKLLRPGLLPEVKILATDLSKAVLQQAESARYDFLSIGRGLSQERLNRYFKREPDGAWKLSRQDVRDRIEFRTFNLMDSFLSLGKFDIIFCRNVLIYFSASAKLDILRRFHGVLQPGGYLVLGASEALSGLPDHYTMIQCRPGIIYQAK